VVEGVLHEGVEDGTPGTTSARSRHRGHPAHAPGVRSAVGSDESDRDELAQVEDAHGECAGRLVCRQVVERLVWSQDRLAQLAGSGDRDLADFHR
jgi:hypothetical protein